MIKCFHGPLFLFTSVCVCTRVCVQVRVSCFSPRVRGQIQPHSKQPSLGYVKLGQTIRLLKFGGQYGLICPDIFTLVLLPHLNAASTWPNTFLSLRYSLSTSTTPSVGMNNNKSTYTTLG